MMQIEQFLDVLSFNFLSYLVNNDISSLQNFSFDNVYFGNCEELKLTSNIYENIIFMGGSHFLMCVLFFFSFFFTTNKFSNYEELSYVSYISYQQPIKDRYSFCT